MSPCDVTSKKISAMKLVSSQNDKLWADCSASHPRPGSEGTIESLCPFQTEKSREPNCAILSHLCPILGWLRCPELDFSQRCPWENSREPVDSVPVT